jgi:hypothetical protein
MPALSAIALHSVTGKKPVVSLTLVMQQEQEQERKEDLQQEAEPSARVARHIRVLQSCQSCSGPLQSINSCKQQNGPQVSG